MKQRQRLPSTICFRVTRACNTRCDFCLAPQDQCPPDEATLSHRLQWLLLHGVRQIRFCGGEPTVHPALPSLLAQAHAAGATTALTTNGIALCDELLDLLCATRTRVRVSLHGDRHRHDSLVLTGAFDRSSAGLSRLLAAGVAASVQSVVVQGGLEVVEWGVEFCLERRVRRFTLLPFLPRGRGIDRRDRYTLESGERRALRQMVARQRMILGSRLDVRLLDFHRAAVPVLETDGRIVWEGFSEATDVVIDTVPSQARVDGGVREPDPS